MTTLHTLHIIRARAIAKVSRKIGQVPAKQIPNEYLQPKEEGWLYGRSLSLLQIYMSPGKLCEICPGDRNGVVSLENLAVSYRGPALELGAG